MNKKIRDFENQLINLVANSDLPAEIIRLVIKDVYDDVVNLSNSAIANEAQSEEGKEDAVSEN